MRSNALKFIVFSVGILISMLACSFSGVAGTPAPLPATEVFQNDSAPRIAMLISQHLEESGNMPPYTLNAEIPFIQNSDDARVLLFNQQVNALAQTEMDAFRAGLVNLATPPIASGSFFSLRYTLLSPPGDVLSLKFTVDIYIDGAAHPFGYTRVFTYDMLTGQTISLDQLFLPGSDYLSRISEYCKAELLSRDSSFDSFMGGADPTPENYANWNITPDGLLITFDMYQVAPYAAGPQLVTVPYDVLYDLIAADGPLALYK